MLGFHLMLFDLLYGFSFSAWTWYSSLGLYLNKSLMSGLYPAFLLWQMIFFVNHGVSILLSVFRKSSMPSIILHSMGSSVVLTWSLTACAHTINDSGWYSVFFEHLIPFINWCSKCLESWILQQFYPWVPRLYLWSSSSFCAHCHKTSHSVCFNYMVSSKVA